MCPNVAPMLVPGVVGTCMSSSESAASTAAVSAVARVWMAWSKEARVIWRMLSTPELALRDASSDASSASGMGAPLSWCADMRLSASGCQHQFSSIWLGASTKSRSTCVPENIASCAFEQTWCITWPNSWKNVSTSPCESSAGFASVGFGKLHTAAATGCCQPPPAGAQPGCSPKHAAWPYLPSRGCMSM